MEELHRLLTSKNQASTKEAELGYKTPSLVFPRARAWNHYRPWTSFTGIQINSVGLKLKACPEKKN